MIFVHRHLMSKELSFRLQGFIKTTVFDTILASMKRTDTLHFRLEYVDESDNVSISLKWKGENCNPVTAMSPEKKSWLIEDKDCIEHQWSEGYNTLMVRL